MTTKQLLEQARATSAAYVASKATPKRAFRPLITNPQAGGSYRIAPTPTNIAFFQRFPA